MLSFTVTITTRKADGSVDKEDIDFRFPESASELPLRKWVDFQFAFQSIPDWMREGIAQKKTGDWDSAQWAAYLAEQVKLLAMLGEIQINGEWEQAHPDDIALLPLNVEFSEQATTKALNNFSHSLSAVFFHILGKLNSHETSDDFRGFEWKGKRFVIPERYKNYAGIVVREMANISVIEAIEALQIEHIVSESSDEKNDKLYRSDIGVMAAVCRMVNDDDTLETMPIDDLERRKFLDERRAFFADIPASYALDVAFFLTSSRQVSEAIRTLATFMKNLPPEMLKNLD